VLAKKKLTTCELSNIFLLAQKMKEVPSSLQQHRMDIWRLYWNIGNGLKKIRKRRHI